ncbi:MAG: chemotaxis protein CheW [Amphiplicatus sp.]
MQDGAIIVFQSGRTRFALARRDVLRIAHAPRLTRPPSAPAPLAGFALWGPDLVAVLRLGVLLGVEGPEMAGLYDHMLLIKGGAPRAAFLVDQATDILDADRLDRRPLAEEETHRGLVVAAICGRGDPILLLNLDRLLSDFERARLRHFHDEEARRRAALGDAA